MTMGNLIKGERVRLLAETKPEAEDRPAPCVKSVRLLKLDGEVRALELTCSCGERSVIELAYSEADPR
jgi:hypothetical protein